MLFKQEALRFHFALGLANYLMNPAYWFRFSSLNPERIHCAPCWNTPLPFHHFMISYAPKVSLPSVPASCCRLQEIRESQEEPQIFSDSGTSVVAGNGLLILLRGPLGGKTVSPGTW